MTHYIRYPLAERPGENGLNRRRQGHVLTFGPELDPGCGQGFASTGQLGAERRLAITGDRVTDFPQGVSRHPLDVVDFVCGQPWGRFDQPSSQLTLQGAHRQAVAEEIMEISGEWAACLALRQTRDLF